MVRSARSRTAFLKKTGSYSHCNHLPTFMYTLVPNPSHEAGRLCAPASDYGSCFQRGVANYVAFVLKGGVANYVANEFIYEELQQIKCDVSFM